MAITITGKFSTQTRSIFGAVTDGVTRAPLVGATVSFVGSSTYTGLDGGFRIFNPQYVSGLFKVSSYGYDDESMTVTAPYDCESLQLDVAMSLHVSPAPAPPPAPSQPTSAKAYPGSYFWTSPSRSGHVLAFELDTVTFGSINVNPSTGEATLGIQATFYTGVSTIHWSIKDLPYLWYAVNDEWKGELHGGELINLHIGESVKVVPMSRAYAQPPPAAAESAATLRWRQFQQDPTVISFLGTLPDTTLNAFSRVFQNYDIYTQTAQAPEFGHYASVGLVVAGLSVAAAAGVYQALAFLGLASGTMTGSVDVVREGVETAIEEDVPATAMEDFLAGFFRNSAANSVPSLLRSLGSQAAKNPLLALMLVAQLDIIAWGLGFSPANVHEGIQKTFNNFSSYKISFEQAVKASDWTLARSMLDNMKSELSVADSLLKSFGVSFFGLFGFSYEDMRQLLVVSADAVAAYEAAYPQLKPATFKFPSEFTLENVVVEDGDTIEFPGHPEVMSKIRLLGIDAHESGTAAGQVETECLRSLIGGKSVTVKVTEYQETPEDRVKLIDMYGRLLAGVFVGGKDAVLEMLRMFGPDLLTKTSYRKKYSWIDWNEYTRTAKGENPLAPVTGSLYLTSSPTGARIYVDSAYTNHLTPETLKLTPGSHFIVVTKTKYDDWTKPVDVIAGVKIEELAELVKAAAAAPITPAPSPGPAPAPAAEPFSITVTSSPSNAKLYIDGTYTHHRTPSNEKELKDVLTLLTPGTHTLRAELKGKAGELPVTIVSGKNPDVMLTLQTVGLGK